MRKIKDVLRLRYELGLGQRQIARSCAIAQATVADYLKRAEAAGIGWPPPPDWDEARLERAVFGAPAPQPPKTGKALPDMAAVREQLQRHRDLTLQLIWEEYRQNNPDGCGYSYFCERYERWRRQQDVVLRQEHRPGEKLFVDWAGATIPIYGADGAIVRAPLFVSALGVSSYTYAELTSNQQMENWLKVQMHAFEFYGGCPRLWSPTTPRPASSKPAAMSRISTRPTRSSPPITAWPSCQRGPANHATRRRWKAPYKWCSVGS